MLNMLKTGLFVLSITILWPSLSAAAEKKVLTPPGPTATRPFSPGIMVGDTIYVSGQVGRDASGKAPANFEDEVKATLESIDAILKAGGASLADAVAVQVYLTDMSLFEKMNGVYVKYFPDPKPTRTTVGVAKLAGDFKIEITVTARVAGAGKGKKKKK